MKKRLVESTPVIPAKKKAWWITVQQAKNILILNIHQYGVLRCRHCINIDTHEYATLQNGEWRQIRINEALDVRPDWAYYYNEHKIHDHFQMSKEDGELICSLLEAERHPVHWRDPYRIIDKLELERDRDMRTRKEVNRIARVNALMNRMPQIPVGIHEWINQREIAGEDYATRTEKQGIYACSKCGEKFEESALKCADGKKKVRDRDVVLCPVCGTSIRLLKRKKTVDILTHFAIVQPIDDEISVVRHFDAVIFCGGGRKEIGIDEAVRIVLYKEPGKTCALYYNQYGRGRYWAPEGTYNYGCFDNKANPANRGEYKGYLYDEGIEEAFSGTVYEKWSRIFTQMAVAGRRLDYNRLMIAHKDENFVRVVELLFKGRFYKLLEEVSEQISVWYGEYTGGLKVRGNSIEEVFGIDDRQKINRIRDRNGGTLMLEWMHWSEMEDLRISDKTLDWILKNRLQVNELEYLMEHMSPEQTMNYVERQRRESYPGSSTTHVISQYKDYMGMCRKLKKNLNDEMVYRPRELKRRHDEAVAAVQILEAELKADDYRKRFPGAEEVLHTIREKFEYENVDYRIIVPNRLVDIVAEGRYLHHCAGSSDRYFDRIMQKETYICFLRKQSEPEIPYYTIEVEPGGTIRQHRGYLDEEPEIEQVKPFLKEWQKVIRKRMSEQDHELAAVSREKREANIEELKSKNNIRVLQGLMEDFMEAM